jgi:hypothetical protein
MGKTKLGDIFEINTSIGKAYLHYIYKDPTIGDLIRVLPGLYALTPDNFESLASSKERYMVFFPISLASNKKIVSLVGYSPINSFAKPSFMRIEHDDEGWDIINTETWQRHFEKKLSPEHIQMSPWGVWNAAMLKARLEEEWHLENWR